ncbi:Zinc/iron permease [Catenaria anguillulae PL171]|uniref:Zinc/iron permease n=1 Tax=Catenaria anguillulae PL171 TaxID=765915 RepID=A0A1Y2HIR2_9FUNG|nr:Zinc/iron permease [Catenaria anguillulae PL171]
MRSPQLASRLLALATLALACAPLVLAQAHDDHDGHDHGSESSSKGTKLSPALVWVAAMTTQLIMTVLAVLGLLLVPLLANRPRLNRLVMTLLIGLAAGTLLGDAVIHLIPHSMIPHDLLEIVAHAGESEAGHDHAGHDHGHDHDHDHGHDHGAEGGADLATQLQALNMTHSSIMWVAVAVVAGAYLFYIVETLLHSYGHTHHDHGDHGHGPIVEVENGTNKTTPHRNGVNMAESEFDAAKVKPVAWLILFGDAVHNFFDGLAVGISFASSWTLGLTTAIAVLLHELPHELGDYAVLLEAGIPKFRAAIYNLISNLTAFVGAAIGILLYNAISESAKNYVLAVTAGGFIYIALADLVPMLFSMTFGKPAHGHDHSPVPPQSPKASEARDINIKEEDTSAAGSKRPSPPMSQIVVANVGFILGVVLMVLVGLYEESTHAH